MTVMDHSFSSIARPIDELKNIGIGLFANAFLLVIVLGLWLLIFLSSRALGTLDEITAAERQKYRSQQLAHELIQSSEDLTKAARSYVVTGNPAYERFFYEILDIRNGELPRPSNYSIDFWKNVIGIPARETVGDAVSLGELMHREGFSERELGLLQQAQELSDKLANVERQAFAALKGQHEDRYEDEQGNLAVGRGPDRDLAIRLLHDENYAREKARIMVPISQFMLELDNRTQTRLSNLQSSFQQQLLLILGLLCIALVLVLAAAFYVRRNILRPLDDLRRQASSIAQGSYSTRCDISTHNEIAELGTGFNTMAEAIEHEITKLKRAEGSLRERLKEIRCFYAIRRGMESGSLDEVCAVIFEHLPAAMQFPDNAMVRIELDGRQFVSAGDEDGRDRDEGEGGAGLPLPQVNRLDKEILVYGKVCGAISVSYMDDRPFMLPEEQSLVDVIGTDLGKWLEHKQAVERILVEQELRGRDAAMREFAAHVERMREEDRKYIAREIHDELGQLLAALHLEISMLKCEEDERGVRLRMIRRNMAELVDKADQSVRGIAEHLRPASLELGIVSAIRKLAEEFRKHSGVNCKLRVMVPPIDLAEDQTVAIFRIVQESLTNVARHAEASRVEITLSWCEGNLVIEVRDDGKGLDSEGASARRSFGLLGMRERAAVVGGTIDIVSAPRQGTIVSVSIPMQRNADG